MVTPSATSSPDSQGYSQLQKRTDEVRVGQQPLLGLLKGLLSRLALRTQASFEASEAQSLGRSGSGSHEAFQVFPVCGLRSRIPNGVL